MYHDPGEQTERRGRKHTGFRAAPEPV